MDCFIIFPHHLFNKKFLPKCNRYFIIEDHLFFGSNQRIKNFNKLKLVLHRASMKYYYDYLKDNDFNVSYIDYDDAENYNFLNKFDKICFYETSDHLLLKNIKKYIDHNNKDFEIINSPLFLLSLHDLQEYNDQKKIKNKFFHKNFYIWQINKLKIPFISKSYDKENRKPLPKNINIPPPTNNSINDNETDYVIEAKKYVDEIFPNNYGNTQNFFFPITHATSRKFLLYFLKNKLDNFGNYQDAILKKNPFLFHSLLSSLLNIGLLTPKEVLDETIDYYKKNKSTIKINNFEGFIRQLVGWREYERMLYQLYYDQLISSNYFNNKRKLNKNWYKGTTGIEPIDDTIKIAFDFGYLHHIQRLMVMLNFMNLCRIRPEDIYDWFMEFSCDSYDWVMIGNIYGMGYFNTDTMTRPYLSTSNYITKMSDYKNNGEWNIIWDGLFYKFLIDNENKLKGGAAFYLRNLGNFKRKKLDDRKNMMNKTNKFIRDIL